jgi:hypothetical protein
MSWTKPASSCLVQALLIEDYVLTGTTLVRLETLVEGVGIGKGKQDLTGLSVDFLKSTQVIPVRPKIPKGRVCTMLTHSEVICTLSGDFK